MFLNRRLKRSFWWGASLLSAIGVFTLAACWATNSWSRADWISYVGMTQECHPVWRDFHSGRIRVGDDVEEVIAQTRPSHLVRDGDTVTLYYYQESQDNGEASIHLTSVAAQASGGKMTRALASSCTWTREFFDASASPSRD